MGRRSIPIQPIRDERNRAVTFVKRKAGLFKKAHELSVLCQVEIALVIVGNNGKIFEFSSSSVDHVMKRYKKTEVQEFKTTKDFSGQPQAYHSRKSSQIDSEDDDEQTKEDTEYYQPQQQQQQPQGAPGVQPPPQVQQQQLPPVQQPVQPTQMVQQQQSQPHQPPPPITLPPSQLGRPKLTVQIPHAAQAQEEAKKQSTGWTPQRMQMSAHWGQPQDGVSPSYYQAAHDMRMHMANGGVAGVPGGIAIAGQQQQQQHGQSSSSGSGGSGGGEPTPISTTLPSKYMMDQMQSPSNFFSSEWGVPWSANPNSGFMRPGPMSQPHPTMGQPGPIQSQQQQQQQDPRQIPPPGMYLPPNVNLYSGGMPSAGVQTMFQSSPVQFTPNDAKRKAEDPLQGDTKRKDF